MRRVTYRYAAFWASVFLGVAAGEGGWTVYEDARLIAHPYNDGDSVHVRAGGGHFIFRLYFVDAPETDDRIAARVAEQAAVFGLDTQSALRLGREAAAFTDAFLQDGFTVYTRMEDAMGQSERNRYFALLEADGRDLGEALAEAGLARVYGKWTDLPNGVKGRDYVRHLDRVADRARRDGRGAWGAARSLQLRRTAPQAEAGGMTLLRATAVYTLDDPPRRLGVLPRGAAVRVLGAESMSMVRIRFDRDGETVEAQCRRTGLGL
ncbi:MAG: thermonuclease family protein [Lentisphaerae bacterium]|nr:thermonuclease family protein [Lentisphaerota bacterium]